MRLSISSVISTVGPNPYRDPASRGSRMYSLYRAGMTVLDYMAAVRLADLGGDRDARRYVNYEARRGNVTVTTRWGRAVEFRPLNERRPRARATALASTALSSPAPLNLDDFTFGVELECYMPRGTNHAALARSIAAATGLQITNELYGHTTRTHWKVITDGSLRDYARGTELVSPILRGEEGLRQVVAVCNAAKAAGCTVDRSCGLHVHVGARGRPVTFFTRLLQLYQNNEGVIDQVMPASRRGRANHYCQPCTGGRSAASHTDLDGLLRSVGTQRYKKLNYQAYFRHGTVEFRHHSGTVEAAKAENWVRLCLRMCAAAASATAEVRRARDLGALMAQLGATAEEAAYFEARRAHFNAPATAPIEEAA